MVVRGYSWRESVVRGGGADPYQLYQAVGAARTSVVVYAAISPDALRFTVLLVTEALAGPALCAVHGDLTGMIGLFVVPRMVLPRAIGLPHCALIQGIGTVQGFHCGDDHRVAGRTYAG